MLKLRIAICLALFVGTLTMMIGLVNEARFTTIIYRTVVTFLFFGACGLVFGSIAERFLHDFLQRLTNRGQVAHVAQEEETLPDDDEAAGFSPFTPDNFEHIEPNKE